ncbi:MAG TPA: GNAT family N-acetyltransferase [Nocardioides sp.]|jgi:GNAT superfamily N-acetyltransferase|uniref:GNAT family N-acetyltransferase n=1 Tax=Nocardioides sp. TaxID=35761 RepID=UPI002E34A1A6|nr:GNAT family N-acetyltransferase [Nocardioides sp.]HEX3930596.1 GNAT family N-acetyltransferase [Nocardioides sp.]
MSRSPVALRDAMLADAEQLAELWQPFLRRGAEEQLHDLASTIEQLGERPGERLLVADYDGVFAGAAFLKAGTYSPVNPEPVLEVHNAAVVAAFRRRGIGKVLVEAAVTWAEELGIGHVATAAASGSREANRFMARLALGPQAVLRVAPTPAVRARLTSRSPGTRQVTQVLAVRRSLRHARSVSGTISGS